MSEDKVWERQALEHLLLENLKEAKRNRRWRTFWRVLVAIILIGIIILMFDSSKSGKSSVMGKHTAMVSLQGVISSTSNANASDINAALVSAFDNPESVGVVLKINSPGGSPVQAGMIHDEILRLRKLHPNKPLHVVVEDICASGGYYVAVAADKIYVDKGSLVGSIGVIMEGFGFNNLMDKLGVDRRLIIAGENKAMLDPFSKENPKQRAKMQAVIDEVHAQFIKVVKDGRGNRLKEDPDMFTGQVWTGARTIELGLADQLGSVEYVAREVFKQEDVVDYTNHENIAERVAKRFGASAGVAFGQILTQSMGLK